ncbi:MAG: heme A synthase, partial [Kofleriaceae bacterium]|nr:heme A synthase [Kofleriaceae bacterium]
MTIPIAWAALVINVFTVLGGTLVRATGSGAGCGESWPSCHGSLLPGFDDWHTRIEFAHRAFSGMALISVVVLVVSAYRNFEKGSQAR